MGMLGGMMGTGGGGGGGMMGGMGGLFDMMGNGMMGGGAPQRAPESFHTLPRGTPVLINGVCSKPELNGKVATVQNYNADRDRYTVVVQGGENDGPVALGPDKLEHLVQGVHIVGLSGRPELNGQQATVVNFDKESGRFRVQVESKKEVVSLKPDNFIMPDGTSVEIMGVQKQPQLNGRRGKIRSFDKATGRYNVQFSASDVKSMKPANVRP